MRGGVIAGALLLAACGRVGFAPPEPGPDADTGLGTLERTAILKASNPGAVDFFGYAVALSADRNTLVSSARWEDAAGPDPSDNGAPNAGALYVFERSGSAWTQTAYLKASDAGAGMELGLRMALSADGNTVIAGAVGDAGATGAGYVFVRSGATWIEQAKLVASDPASGAYFGGSVAVSDNGDTVAIGAYGVNGMRGAAYVFTRSGGVWTEAARFVSPAADDNDQFGDSLTPSGDGLLLAVGAPREDSAATGIDGDPQNNAASDAGGVFVYRRDASWTFEAYLKASVSQLGLVFGHRLASTVDGSRLAIAAIGHTGFRGAVYVFAHDAAGWREEAFIAAANGDGGDENGWTLDLAANGSVLVTGARSERSAGLDPADNSAVSAGAAYVFVRTGASWNQHSYLKPEPSLAGGTFGHDVTIVGTTVLVGMIGESTTESQSGAVYVFEAAP